MSLNKYMHPRNRYKNKKPSFLELALKYPDFRQQVTQDESGKVFLDFKNADALRTLTTCCLKEDFDLTVHLPSDRLVPTLPLRLNYIHWLEDIVGTEPGKWGIDVGTGASCVYPLLAAKVQQWNFLATESDPENFFHAQKNVATNNLQDLIHVKQVTVEDVLSVPMENFNLVDKFDFCLCNPPFFADHMEAQAISSSRNVDRPEAQSVSTASPQECIAKGGEVGFIRQMIEESTVLQNKIRLYSSMVGKKTSLTQLKEELRHQKVPKFATTEFCQGKTMRWGIAWSFDESISFPKSQFDSKKEKKPLQWVLPKGAGGIQYNVHAIAGFLKELLSSIKVHCYQGKSAKSYTSITLTAVENTWCHQRRRRRQQKRQELEEKNKNESKESSDINSNNTENLILKSNDTDDSNDDHAKESHESLEVEKTNSQTMVESSDVEKNDRKRLMSAECSGNRPTPSKIIRLELDDVENCKKGEPDKAIKTPEKYLPEKSGTDSEGTCSSQTKTKESPEGKQDISLQGVGDLSETSITEDKESPKDYILKCVLRMKRGEGVINMELDWLGGTSRELLHQLKTFLVNKCTEHVRLPK